MKVRRRAGGRPRVETISNLTRNPGPAARIGFEAEVTARLRPYLRSRPVRDVDLHRGDGNAGTFRHDVEHDAIPHDAIAVRRAPCCTCWALSAYR